MPPQLLAALPLLLASPPARADLVVPSLQVSPPAPKLAAMIAEASGDPYALPGLRFTFVVSVDGTEKARRTHTWCPQDGLVEVRTGDQATRISAVDGSPVDGSSAEAAEQAWGAFINDQYWLLAPSKVMDEGVQRRLGTEPWSLALEFDGVGLTPGDRYELRVGQNDLLVRRWSFTLQSGRTGEFAWRQYEQVGPLHLSTARVALDGSKAFIRFTDLAALDRCPLTPQAQPTP